mmetsp:Transcript_23280/g.40065  ORF Transcript_23280/g.40065 Transcript_23280/m.40065 type:complete len:167 (+) Transcript_23280:7-507(+)
MKNSIFVTVGTTSFDLLIKTVNSADFRSAARAKGYNHITCQIGRGTYVPNNNDDLVSTDWYRFRPSLSEDYSTAALVISHAGAGSIMEALGLDRPLIVVVNEDLMDNHQIELAEELSSRKHLSFAFCRNLVSVFSDLNLDHRISFPPPQTANFAKAVDNLMGLSHL